MTATPRIGALRKRLALEAPTDMPDDTGAFSRSWTQVANVWGEVTPVSGQESFSADAIEVAISHRVTIRARPDVVNGMRFRLGTRALLIRAVVDPDGRDRHLLCRCEEFAP